jgi:flagellar M-ring protein FliF
VERVEDRYDPTRSALRSEESTIDRNAAAVDTNVAGIPGAESNVPAVTGDAGAPKMAAAPKVADLPMRESHTRNFELDHVTEKRVTSGGAIKHIAVAVIVDGVPKTNAPRSKEDLDKLAALVRSAVGATDARGDVVTVESIPFADDTEAAPTAAAVAVAAAPIPKWRAYAPVAAGGALFVVVGMMWAVSRRKRARAKREAELLLAASAPAPAQIEPASDDPADLRAAALERARRDPATAALVLRLWLGATPSE